MSALAIVITIGIITGIILFIISLWKGDEGIAYIGAIFLLAGGMLWFISSAIQSSAITKLCNIKLKEE